nr:glycosyltransferase 87 family protein [Corynebacterium lactis]
MLMDRLSSLSVLQRRILTAVFGLVSATVVIAFIYRAATYYMMDVEVFQDAGWAFRRGQDLYSENFPTRSGFRFIYPPFAALLFYPLTWAGPTTLQIIWTIATMVAVWAMLWMVSTRLRAEYPKLLATGLLGIVLLLDPLRANILFGQINVFLALLIIADVLGFLPKKLRGLGVGVAAGIKITPAAYALVFLMRRDFAAVAKSFGWFLVTVAIGFAVRFQESIYFWTDEFFASNRGGAPTYEANQAFSGLLARAGLEGTALEVGTYGFFLFGAVAAAFVAWVFQREGHEVTALGFVALAVSFAGPYAVSHHWSIVMVFFPLLLFYREIWHVAVGVLFFIAQWWAPYEVFVGNDFGRANSVGQWFYGNMQGVMGFVAFFAILGYAIYLWRNPRRVRA